MSTVSVIIPTYNRAATLPRAIDSVLEQQYDPIEVIVVDDHSSDETATVAAEYGSKITYVRLDENRGGSHARNVGLERATGDYVAFLDDDDEWHDPTKLRKQVERLESLDDEWIGVYCGVEFAGRSLAKRAFDRVNSEREPPRGDDDVAGSLLMMDGLVHGGSTLLLEREAVTAIGGFDESFPRRQDVEFVVRLTAVGKIDYLDEDLVTLYDTPGASPEDVLRSQRLLVDRFADRISELEQQGYEIHQVHALYTGRQHLRQGNLREAASALRSARPSNLRHGAGLVLDSYRGGRTLARSAPTGVIAGVTLAVCLLASKPLWDRFDRDGDG